MRTPTPDFDIFPPRYVASAYRAAARYGLNTRAAHEVVHQVCSGIADQRKVTDVVDRVATYLMSHRLDLNPDRIVRSVAKELGYDAGRGWAS